MATDQGTLGEEALRLLEALQYRLVRAGMRGLAGQLGGRPAAPADVWSEATREQAAGLGESPECRVCPVCQAIRAARSSGIGDAMPDVINNLSAAGESLLAAVRDVLAAAGRSPAGDQADQADQADRADRRGPRGGSVQHIDIG